MGIRNQAIVTQKPSQKGELKHGSRKVERKLSAC